MEIAPEHRSYESIPIGIVIVSGRFLVYANAAWSSLFRRPRETVVGKELAVLLTEMVSTDDARWTQELHQRSIGGGRLTEDNFWVRVAAEHAHVPMIQVRRAEGPRPGERLYVIQSAESESDLRQFTEALTSGVEGLMRCRTEEEVLEAAVDTIYSRGLAAATLFPEGDHYRHGPMRQPLDAQRMAEKLYGIKDMREHKLPRLPHLDEVLASGKAVFHPEFMEILRPAHSPEVMAILDALPKVRAVDTPLFVDGVACGILAAIGPQLTPAMAASVELFARQVGAAMENARHHALASEQLRKLHALQDELVAQERLAVLGSAAGVLAHEVRNPLAAMINGLSILRRDPELSDEGRGVLAMVDEESQRLERLVHDLLDFTRPLEPKLAQVELADVPRRAVSLLRERRDDRGLKVTFEADDGAHPYEGDAHLLGLAVENLLRNAVQASPPGGSIRLSATRAASGYVIAVEDDGPGVPDEDVQRIFEPFITTRAKGSGLGLPIVRRIARAHGGSVYVRRAPSGGARFELSLPTPPTT